MKPPRIVENSVLARMARLKLGTQSVAMVLGNSIHLSGATKDEFLNDPYWVAHEMEHIRQFAEYGTLGFLSRYLVGWARFGYYHIPFEVQAREAGHRNAALYAQGRPLPELGSTHQGAGPKRKA